MIRTKITRTLQTTKIKGYKISMVDGKPVIEDLEEIAVCGMLTDDEALKQLGKVYGKSATVGNITYDEAVYEISVEDFLKYATKIDPKKEEKE